MYALCITLCVTAGGNAFPQPQRRFRIWYYDLVLEDFISLIDVFSDVFRRGTASHHRHEIIINLCVSHFGYFFRISRIMDFRILIYSGYHLLWLFLCSDMLLCLLLGTLYVFAYM